MQQRSKAPAPGVPSIGYKNYGSWAGGGKGPWVSGVLLRD